MVFFRKQVVNTLDKIRFTLKIVLLINCCVTILYSQI